MQPHCAYTHTTPTGNILEIPAFRNSLLYNQNLVPNGVHLKILAKLIQCVFVHPLTPCMSRFTQSQSEANKWNWTWLGVFCKVKQQHMIYWTTALAVQPKLSEAKQLTNHAIQPQQLAGENKAQVEVFNWHCDSYPALAAPELFCICQYEMLA